MHHKLKMVNSNYSINKSDNYQKINHNKIKFNYFIVIQIMFGNIATAG